MNALTQKGMLLLGALALFQAADNLLGGTDTWSGSGGSNRWSDAGNWTPNKPVNNDAVIFDASARTSVLADFSSVATNDPNANNPQAPLTLLAITFPASAPSYTIELYSDVAAGSVFNANLALSGSGVTKLSGQTQTFVLDAGTVGNNAPAAPGSTMRFNNSAVASAATYTLKGGNTVPISPGPGLLRSEAAALYFNNTSSATNGTFNANGGAGNGGRWARVEFHDTSTASTATFTNQAGQLGANFQNQSPPQVDGFGGQTNFYNSAVAATAHFINQGEAGTGGSAGGVQFFDTANADHGVFDNNASSSGSNGGLGGFTEFDGSASASHGTFNNQPGQGAFGRGQTGFFGSSTAANGLFQNTGGDNSYGSGGVTFFRDSATAGSGTFNNYGTGQLSGSGGQTLFFDSSNAGTGTFTNVGGVFGPPGTIEFSGSSSAASGTFYVTVSNRGGNLNFRNTATAGQGKFFTNGASGTIAFYNSSTAANATFTLSSNSVSGAFLQFRDSSTAGNATLDVGTGSDLQFYETSTGAQSNITVRGYGAGPGGGNGSLLVGSTLGNAVVNLKGATVSSGSLNVGGANGSIQGPTGTADNSLITIGGGDGTSSSGASLLFTGAATAGNATLITNGGTNGGSGGFVYFNNATGGTARIITNAGGTFDVSRNESYGGTAVGSIEGAGTYILGGSLLSTGSRNTDTIVSGVISDGGPNFNVGGMLTKVGTGALRLNGTNAYTGLTTVAAGRLFVNGSIPGPVHVNGGGALGGSGTIGGAVTLDPGAILAPGNSPGTITVGSLVLASNANLLMEVGGTAQGSTYDSVNALGNVTLGGELAISLTNGFIPAASDNFIIVNAGGTLSGSFSNAPTGTRVHNPDGSGSFIVSYSASSVGLSNYLTPGTTFAAWQNSHFTPQQLSNPTFSGQNADPDHDGLSNVLEYALNADPTNPSSTNRPTVTLDPIYLSLTYTKVLGATDLTYSVEQATALRQWGSVTPVNQILSDNGFVQVIKAKVPRTNAGAGGKLFLRLRVTQQ